MFAGSRIATGDCTLVWPPSDGSSPSANSGTASAVSRAREGGVPRSGRSSGSMARTISQASAPRPQARPKRVPSTSLTVSGRAADQNVEPSPTAPWSTSAAKAERKPTIAATSRIRSSRATNGRDVARARRQITRKKISVPRPSAIAAYWKPRANASAVLVIGPVPPPASSWSSDSAGAAASPTVKTKPLETGWPSADTTR